MTYYFKSLNFYKGKWERHNQKYLTLDDIRQAAYKFNKNTGRAVKIYSVENKTSVLIMTIVENTD